MTATDQNQSSRQPGAVRFAALLLCTLAALHCAPDQLPPERGATPSQPILSPSNPQIAYGTAQQFTVRSVHSDGRIQDVTNQVTWRIASERADSLPQPTDGLVELATPGRYQLFAEYQGHRLDTVIVVTAATLKALDLTPTTAQVAKGLSQQFKATASFSDGTTQDVTTTSAWSVKDTTGSGVATVTTRGLALGKQVGKARVSARYKTLTSAAVLTVNDAVLQTLTISPTDPTVAKGTAQRFTAQGTFSDGTVADLSGSVDWAIADLMGSGVAAIDGLGNATGLAEGQATVSAAYVDQIAETGLTVSPAVVTGLAISPTAPTITKGGAQQFRASAVLSDGSKQDVSMMAAWTATDVTGAGVASVDGNGLAKGNAVGTASIQCLFRGYAATAVLGVTAPTLTTLTITPTSASLAKGLTQAFTVLGTYSDGSTGDLTAAAIWNAADVMGTDVATISATGVVRAKNEGKARLLSSYLGKSASATLTVTSAVPARLAISPSGVSIAVAATQQFAAQAIYTDGSVQDVTARTSWSATDVAPGSGVASITAGGLLTAKTKGQSTVAASFSGLSAEALVSVGFPKVASVYCSTDTALEADVKLKLENLHVFSRVDNLDMSSVVPTLATLQQYDAVLVWADLSRGGCSYPTDSANVLSQYVDAGGGVVLISAYYVGNSYSNVYSASWDKYTLIEPGGMTYVSSSKLGTADMTHPVLQGITKVTTNGSRCYQRSGVTGAVIRSGARAIATWTDGNAMVVVGSPMGKPRVDINMSAYSSDIGSNGCYDSTSDVPKLIGNALLWVSGR